MRKNRRKKPSYILPFLVLIFLWGLLSGFFSSIISMGKSSKKVNNLLGIDTSNDYNNGFTGKADQLINTANLVDQTLKDVFGTSNAKPDILGSSSNNNDVFTGYSATLI